MNIKTIVHKGLKDYIEKNNAKGLSPEKRPRIQNILAALILAEDISGVEGPPGWKIHQLKGERTGEWSISVSGNWRITFKIKGGEIIELNYEDYH